MIKFFRRKPLGKVLRENFKDQKMKRWHKKLSNIFESLHKTILTSRKVKEEKVNKLRQVRIVQISYTGAIYFISLIISVAYRME